VPHRGTVRIVGAAPRHRTIVILLHGGRCDAAVEKVNREVSHFGGAPTPKRTTSPSADRPKDSTTLHILCTYS
jgi:hypothetical protein